MGSLYFYEYLPVAAASVLALIESDPALVVGATEQARGRAEDLAARLSFSIGKVEVGKQVRVTLGEALLEPGACWLPMRWRATKGGAWLFPHMKGKLEIQALSESECQLSLIGDYTPPLGTFGAIADLLVMHQVAEASVCAFVQGLKARIEQAEAARVAAVPA